MKKTIATILMFLFSATPVFGAYTYTRTVTVDHTKVHGEFKLVANCAGAGNVSTSATCTIDTTGANLIVIAVSGYSGGTCVLSDSKSNTWTAINTVDTNISQKSVFYYAYAPTVGSGHSFTYSGSACYAAISVLAFSGAASSPLDQQNSYENIGSTITIQPGSITPGSADELVVTMIGSGAAGTVTPDFGFVKANQVDYVGGSNYGVGVGWTQQTTASATNPTWHINGDSYSTAHIASFKIGTAPLSNYPVLVCANGSSPCNTSVAGLNQSGGGAHVKNASGYDIAFSTVSGCGSGLLNWEMEKYVPATGEMEAWVKAPSLSNTSDYTIYMCYGDTGISSFQGGATGSVWDSNFKAVYHLPDGSSLTSNDSTSNANNSSSQTGVTATAGQIDGAASFDGTSGHEIIMPNTASLQSVGGTLTLSSWVNFNSGAPAGGFLSMYLNGGSGSYVLGSYVGNIYFWVDDNSNTGYLGRRAAQPVDSNWHYVVGVYTGGTSTSGTKIYVDGVQTDNADFTSNTFVQMRTSGDAFKIGGLNGGVGGPFTGLLDEPRLTNKVLSPDWILTDYNNQYSPSTFCSFGSESGAGGSSSQQSGGNKVILKYIKMILSKGHRLIIL